MSPMLRPLFAYVSGCVLGLSLGVAAVAPISVPRFTHPGAGRVFYFVLTDRFANGSTANDTGGIPGGRDENGFDPTVISHYHGGDLAGLTQHLDYIKQLGATAIWLTPPFVNKPVQGGSAGYHGYWILDFLHIDPHLGSDAEFRELVAQAHARGLKVFLDIIVNHTADVIRYRDGNTGYISKALVPNRNARGRPFDASSVAFNGVNSPAIFPALAADRSFPHNPFVPPAEAQAKNPAWLNDVTLYHNRGNSTFQGESSLDGDFSGLDDTFTENPAVVRGFIDIYRHWIEAYGVDGFRIDTVRHVNLEFWQAFAPAIRAEARRARRPDFLQFGEVANDTGDIPLLSAFSTTTPLDTTLDFGFFRAAEAYVAKGGRAVDLARLFAEDDYYTDHDSNVHSTVTFLGNHDAGRFAYFLEHDDPAATREQLARLVKLGDALLFLVRGQPVIYYGDEQGMIGRGGGDMQAREDMFAAQAPEFRNAALLGTTRTGADEKFDPRHPFYRFIQALAALREGNPALTRGAMIARSTDQPNIFAFSRIERGELVEWLAVFNNSRTDEITAAIPTSQPEGAELRRVNVGDGPVDGRELSLRVDAHGTVTVTLPPLQFSVWRAGAPLPNPTGPLTVAFATPASGAVLRFATRDVDGDKLAVRQELRADVSGGDGVAEVTFVMRRRSRPGQYEWLGTDDAPPYRVFWQPPPDLAADDELELVASVDDLRGHRAATRIDGIKVDSGNQVFGIKEAGVPRLTDVPRPALEVRSGRSIRLSVTAHGTPPLGYQWIKDGNEIAGADGPTLTIAAASATDAGRYRVLVRNRAGTAVSAGTDVSVTPAP